MKNIIAPALMADFGRLPPHIRQVIIARGERIDTREDLQLAAELARDRRGCCGNWQSRQS